MNVIDRYPFRDVASRVASPGGEVIVRPFQVVVRVGISVRDVLTPVGPSFPAILNTGLNHNFAIREDQLSSWTGLVLPRIGSVEVDQQVVPLLAANLWIYSNNPGEDTISDALPFRMRLAEGIIVYAAQTANPARLPILGLRAIATNALKLTIDGKARTATLATL
jgi:hypothetical protein